MQGAVFCAGLYTWGQLQGRPGDKVFVSLDICAASQLTWFWGMQWAPYGPEDVTIVTASELEANTKPEGRQGTTLRAEDRDMERRLKEVEEVISMKATISVLHDLVSSLESSLARLTAERVSRKP